MLRKSFRSRTFSSVKSLYKMPEDYILAKKLSVPEFLLDPLSDPLIQSKICIVDGTSGKTRTYGEVYKQTYSLAKSLSGLGVKQHQCVAILAPNFINYFACWNSIGLIGAHSTTINPTYTTEEIEYQLNLTDAKVTDELLQILQFLTK